MSTYYKNKSTGFVLRVEDASEDFIYVTLPGGIDTRLTMNSKEFEEQFEPYSGTSFTRIDMDDDVETFCISIRENRVPEEFGAPVWRNLRLTIGYDEILSAMRDRIVDGVTGALAYPPKE